MLLFVCRTQGDHRSWKFPHFATWAPSYQVRSMQDQNSFFLIIFYWKASPVPILCCPSPQEICPRFPCRSLDLQESGSGMGKPRQTLTLTCPFSGFLLRMSVRVSHGSISLQGKALESMPKSGGKRLSTTTCLWTAARCIESPTPGKINDNVSHQNHIYSMWWTTSWWDTAEHLPWNHKFMFEHGNRIAIVYENNTMKINSQNLYLYNM